MKLWTLVLVLICTGIRAEPLPDFEKLVKRCQGIFDARPVVEVAFVPANKL